MRENTLQFKEAFKHGMSLSDFPLPGADALEYVSGLIPSEGGLRMYEELEAHAALQTALANLGVSYSVWPFPQLVQGSKGDLLFYTIGSKGFIAHISWAAGQVPTITPLTMTNAHTTEALTFLKAHATMWHVADFGLWLFVTDGTDNATIDLVLGTAQVSQAADTNSPHLSVKTCCAFRGRLVLGGLYPSAEWLDVYSIYNNYTVRFDQVWVSSPGGGDTLSLLRPLSWVNTLLSTVSRNSVLLTIPWSINVRRVQALDTGIMAYCSEGVVGYKPVIIPVPTDNAAGNTQATFSQQIVSESGLLARDAVCGTKLRHFYMASDRTLHVIGADFSDTRIGGARAFYNLQLTRICILALDTIRNEVWIGQVRDSGVVTGWVYNAAGLAAVPQAVDSLILRIGARSAIANPLADSGDRTFNLRTEAFDMDLPSTVKFLRLVEAAAPGVDDLMVSVHYLPENSTSWTQVTAKAANAQNVAYSLLCAGVRYKVTLTGSFTSVESVFNYINIRWQIADKRSLI